MGCNASNTEDVLSSGYSHYFSEDQEEEEYVRHPLIPCYDRNEFLIQELWVILGIEFPDIIMNTIDEFASFNITDIALYNPECQTNRYFFTTYRYFFTHISISFWCKPYNPGRETIVLKGTLRDSRTRKKLRGWNFKCSAIGYFDFTLTEGAIRYYPEGTSRSKKMVAFDKWTHICGTYNPISKRKVLYINGEVDYSQRVNIDHHAQNLTHTSYTIAKQELQKLKSLHWDDSKTGTMDNSKVEKIANRISNVIVYSDTLSHSEVRILAKSRSRAENLKKLALTSIDGLGSRGDRNGFTTLGCGPHWKADGLDLMIEVEA